MRHPENKPHIFLNTPPETRSYKSPKAGGGGSKLPDRDRQPHGSYIGRRYKESIGKAKEKLEGKLVGVSGNYRGYYLDFYLADGFKGLERLDSNELELIRVREKDNAIIATVFIPRDETEPFQKRIDQYLNENTPQGKKKLSKPNPKNKPLIEGIDNIDASSIKSLWCDAEGSFPKNNDNFWWEASILNTQEKNFISACKEEKVHFSKKTLKFPDRVIFCVNTNVEIMTEIQLITGAIAELRHLKPTAEFFTSLNSTEQAEWVDELLSRIQWPNNKSPSVCLLDTGVNHGHPLLAGALQKADLHASNPNWPNSDGFNKQYHGTPMAGIALYGNLAEVLENRKPIKLKHKLESVRIVPTKGDNLEDLYGVITQESVARVEVNNPDRLRNFCMAITEENENMNRGEPSSWSAAVDQLCIGTDDLKKKRLMIISAGNIRSSEPTYDYFQRCKLEQIENPAQSWNALTVGAYTDKINIADENFKGYKAIAEVGDLSPFSRTSSIWKDDWPIKPEIVLEGGNQASSPSNHQLDTPDALGLLTTHHAPNQKLFDIMHGTSPATAQAARMAAIIQEQYSYFWPETIRALLVHSAEWTQKMQDRIDKNNTKKHLKEMMRCFGYGVPSLDRALWSAQNALTLISQNEIQPFKQTTSTITNKPTKGGETNHMHFFELPWPKEVLENLGETQVRMKVTLSYFIEPNPSERGYNNRYKYMSHGFGFDVKHQSETFQNFQTRINKFLKEESDNNNSIGDKKWIIGMAKDKGSIHSDIWKGTAADLAERGLVAVFPKVGWWKTHNGQKKWNKSTRYSLIISIETEDENVDLYTPVQNIIEQKVSI